MSSTDTAPNRTGDPGPTTSAYAASGLSRRSRVSGWVLTGLLAAFCLFDAYGKLFPTREVLSATADLGFPTSRLSLIGVLMLIGLALFLVPRTTFVGAVWLSAYFGGAFCTMVTADAPLWSQMLTPVWFGLAVWLTAWLRNPSVRRAGRDLVA